MDLSLNDPRKLKCLQTKKLKESKNSVLSWRNKKLDEVKYIVFKEKLEQFQSITEISYGKVMANFARKNPRKKRLL